MNKELKFNIDNLKVPYLISATVDACRVSLLDEANILLIFL